MKDRLLKFIEYLGTNVYRFEMSCGLSQGYIKNMQNGMSEKKLQQILEVYSQLNRDWLLTGNGPMIIDQSGSSFVNSQVNSGCENVTGTWTSSDYQERINFLEAQVERLQRQLDEERADRRKAEERVDKLLSMLSNG